MLFRKPAACAAFDLSARPGNAEFTPMFPANHFQVSAGTASARRGDEGIRLLCGHRNTARVFRHARFVSMLIGILEKSGELAEQVAAEDQSENRSDFA